METNFSKFLFEFKRKHACLITLLQNTMSNKMNVNAVLSVIDLLSFRLFREGRGPLNNSQGVYFLLGFLANTEVLIYMCYIICVGNQSN